MSSEAHHIVLVWTEECFVVFELQMQDWIQDDVLISEQTFCMSCLQRGPTWTSAPLRSHFWGHHPDMMTELDKRSGATSTGRSGEAWKMDQKEARINFDSRRRTFNPWRTRVHDHSNTHTHTHTWNHLDVHREYESKCDQHNVKDGIRNDVAKNHTGWLFVSFYENKYQMISANCFYINVLFKKCPLWPNYLDLHMHGTIESKVFLFSLSKNPARPHQWHISRWMLFHF